MKKMRIYVDTSVIGGCYDDEFRAESLKLFDEIARGRFTLILSVTTVRELAEAPEFVRQVLGTVGGQSKPASDGQMKTSHLEEVVSRTLQPTAARSLRFMPIRKSAWRRRSSDTVGHATTATWTHADNPDTTCNPDGGVATNEYDNADRLVAAKDTRGNRVAFDLDPMGRVTRRYTPNWQEYTFYDIEGCVTTRLDAVSGRTDMGYDWLNRPIVVVDPLSRIWQTAYDPLGTVTANTDPRFRTTTYGLDAMERRTRIAYPSGRTEGFGFDALGCQTSFTNSEGHVYRMTYDAQNRLLAATNAANEQVFRNFYDASGNLTNHVDGAGRSIRRQFDALNRCTNTVYADGSTETFAYDVVDNLLSARNATATNTFGYDAMDRLAVATTRVAGVSFSVSYGRDLGGLVTSLVYPDGKTVWYSYDLDGRLTNVVDWADSSYGISRDAGGRMTGLTYPNGVAGSWQYDAANAVTSWGYSGGGTGLPGRSVTRDLMGLKTREEMLSGPLPAPTTDRRSVNTFDNADRLTSAQVTCGTSVVVETYGYDPCGALTNVARSAGSNDVYTYDLAGRIISVATSNLAMTVGYDALGNRVKTTVNGVTQPMP